MIHAVVTAITQLLVGFITGDWLIGAALPLGFYVGREHAQAEYRWIERFGGGLRANMPWWGGFDPKVWTLKSVLDWLLPLAAAAAVLVIVG